MELTASEVFDKIVSIRSQKGVTMIEYALTGSLVSFVATATRTLIGDRLDEISQAVVAAFMP